MSAGEIVTVIAATGAALVGIINAIRTPHKQTVEEVHSAVQDIKAQTNGDRHELLRRIDTLISERNVLQERVLTLEKSLAYMAANRQIRASDKKEPADARDKSLG